MNRTIDLNADLGEGCPWDGELLARVTSASIACGGHAGDPQTMKATLAMARDRGVVVGAHPGFADREHFGRREQDITPEQAFALIVDQVQALAGYALEAKTPIRYIKPHGALYNQAQRDDGLARGIVSAAKQLGLPLLGLPGSCVEARAVAQGVTFIAEGFADRRYTPEGHLVPRADPAALLTEPAEIAAQAISLVKRGLKTLCIHGDNPHSLAIADLVIRALKANDVALGGFAGRCSA